MTITDSIQTSQTAAQSAQYKSSQRSEAGVKRTGTKISETTTVVQKTEKKAFHALIDKASVKAKKEKAGKSYKEDGGNTLPPVKKLPEKTAANDPAASGSAAKNVSQQDDQEKSKQGLPLVSLPITIDNRSVNSVSNDKNLPVLKLIDPSVTGENKNNLLTSQAQLLTDSSTLAGKLKDTALTGATNNTAGLKFEGLSLTLNKTQEAMPLSATDLTLSAGDLFKGMETGVSSQKITLDSLLNKLDNITTLVATETKTAAIPLSSTFNTATVSSAQNASSMYQSVLQQPFGQAGWDQGMGRQISWLASQNIHSAELKLNPANLGSIHVRIDIKDDAVNVNFSSHHGMVRDAIEQSLPRLREMMAQQGLNLGDAGISQHNFAQHQQNAFSQQASTTSTNQPIDGMGDISTLEQSALNIHKITLQDGVDYYI